MKQYEVKNTTLTDLPFIYELFDRSVEFQEKRGYPTWRGYDKETLIADIENKNQYKVLVDSEIGIVFSVCYSDKIIWREMETGDALYLHRMVGNPAFKGQRLFGSVLAWLVSHARQRGFRFVRMDTWADNANIIDYYKGFGFTFIGNYITPDSLELPAHNRLLAVALLEIKL